MTEVSKRVVTPLARLSYPHLFQPAQPMAGNTGQAKYQAELIFEGGINLDALVAAANQAAKDKWGNKVPKGLRMPIRDGKEREGKDGYEGGKFISAKSTDKPGIVVGDQQEVCTDPSEIYGGCYVIASVTAFAYDVNGNKGVAFALNNLWKVRDGDPFGNRQRAEDEFSGMDASAYGGGDDLL